MPRPHIIKVPDVGEGIAEVELVQWHVNAGDMVVEDQALADVMTDKASVEIPSPVAGRVIALGGAVGQTLAVGAELIRIEVEENESARAAPPVAGVASAPAPAAAPDALSRVTPTQHAALPAPAPERAADASAQRPIAAPAVRRRAWELGVDLNLVPATGTAGRIVHADLDRFAAAHGNVARNPAATAGGYGAPDTSEQAVPVIGLRRRIALQMQESKRRIPHFSYVEELDVTQIEELRAALNSQWSKERGRLTLLPLLMRAVVQALRDFPQINARFDDDKGVVTRYGAVHLGIATQTPQGLMVPVVKHAQTLDLWAMAAEVARLAEVARSGRATRDELGGSTFTISSLGALGGVVSTPVINRPEVAIIAVNRIVERPVIRGGTVVARRMMNLSSSFDHRVVDGMDAAEFVHAVQTLVEQPALLFID